MQKISFEVINGLFNSRGYTILDENIIDVRTPIRYRCPCHPDKKTQISYDNLRRGRGCPYCAKTVKHKIEDVQEEFLKNGYILLEEIYKSARVPLKYKCLIHPEKNLSITYTNFLRGKRCPYCSRVGKPSIEEVKNRFEEKGYILIDDVYVNNRSNMKCQCKKHPDQILLVKYGDFVSGKGCCCKICFKEYLSKKFALKKGVVWNGVTTSLNSYLRNHIIEWKKRLLKEANYQCVITKNKYNLVVHHLNSFMSIRSQVFAKYNIYIRSDVSEYTEQELDFIVEKFLQEHDKAPGVVLDGSIHRLFHKLYGLQTTEIDFEDFTQRWRNGEFFY